MTEQEKIVVHQSQEEADAADHVFTKLHKIIYTILLMIFVGCVSTLVLWYLDPAPYKNYTREILTPVVPQGGEVKIRITVEWTKTCYSRLRRNVVFSNEVLVPYEREVRLNQVGVKKFEVNQRLPYDAPLGVAKWIVYTDWFCNPLQYFIPNTIQLEPLEFTIIPSKGVADESKLPEKPEARSCVGGRLC